ncbi:MAG TPA: MFS transporter [Acidimicrobiales bacterium]|nr:MFS transporter [Acidimicrobiales bacterium]
MRARRLSRPHAFWSVTAMLGVVLGGSAVVSPLYRVYQVEWHFSEITLTAVFAVYAVTVMAVLLVAGSLSDQVGRRPMVALALIAEAVAAVLFLTAGGVASLYAGRVLQGVATGAGASAAGAAILDLQPGDRPTLGSTVNACGSSIALAVGAMAAGLVVQYAPAPTRLVFWLLLAASLAGVAVLAVVDDPVARKAVQLAHFRPRAGVPAGARRAFVTALPALVATWALGGFFFSLAPSLTEQLAGSTDTVWGGTAVFLLSAPAGLASFRGRQMLPGSAMAGGSAVLAFGSAGALAAIVAGSAAALLVATAVAGVGFGLGFLGAFRHLSGLAPDDERGALVATIYVVSYLAFSVPVVVAGAAVSHFGLHDVAVTYAAVVTVLGLSSALGGARGRRPGQAAAGRPSG